MKTPTEKTTKEEEVVIKDQIIIIEIILLQGAKIGKMTTTRTMTILIKTIAETTKEAKVEIKTAEDLETKALAKIIKINQRKELEVADQTTEAITLMKKTILVKPMEHSRKKMTMTKTTETEETIDEALETAAIIMEATEIPTMLMKEQLNSMRRIILVDLTEGLFRQTKMTDLMTIIITKLETPTKAAIVEVTPKAEAIIKTVVAKVTLRAETITKAVVVEATLRAETTTKTIADPTGKVRLITLKTSPVTKTEDLSKKSMTKKNLETTDVALKNKAANPTAKVTTIPKEDLKATKKTNKALIEETATLIIPAKVRLKTIVEETPPAETAKAKAETLLVETVKVKAEITITAATVKAKAVTIAAATTRTEAAVAIVTAAATAKVVATVTAAATVKAAAIVTADKAKAATPLAETVKAKVETTATAPPETETNLTAKAAHPGMVTKTNRLNKLAATSKAAPTLTAKARLKATEMPRKMTRLATMPTPGRSKLLPSMSAVPRRND